MQTRKINRIPKLTSTQIISQTIKQIPENELIFASKLYAQKFGGDITESVYYESLEWLCKAGERCKIAKGTCCRPKASRYGIVLPSQEEIVAAFTQNGKGTLVGYSLYNSLKLTTQVSKTYSGEAFERVCRQRRYQKKTIAFCRTVYTEEAEHKKFRPAFRWDGTFWYMRIGKSQGEIKLLTVLRKLKGNISGLCGMQAKQDSAVGIVDGYLVYLPVVLPLPACFFLT